MVMSRPEQWDEVFDVVVVGSGGAALTSGVLAADGGASVLVLEKDSALGGTTGVSGGVMWIPNNHHLAEAGLEDSREDGAGQRFMHGGFTYNDFPKAFGLFDQQYPGLPNKPPGWVIFGASVKERQPILTMVPGHPAPDWLPQAGSIRELAEVIGLDPETLERTVARFNEHAVRGDDPDWNTPNVAPIEGPPFYNGGCRLNANGQVLGHRQKIIPGLYAAGNTSVAVLGGAYVGGGTPIASGATFGYIAGHHAGAQPSRDIG